MNNCKELIKELKLVLSDFQSIQKAILEVTKNKYAEEIAWAGFVDLIIGRGDETFSKELVFLKKFYNEIIEEIEEIKEVLDPSNRKKAEEEVLKSFLIKKNRILKNYSKDLIKNNLSEVLNVWDKKEQQDENRFK